MTDITRVLNTETRKFRSIERRYAGQIYDEDATVLHFEYDPPDYLVQTGCTPYIIFDVPDDEGNPQVYSFDGYTFPLNWNITSRVIKSKRVEYQLWFVREEVGVNEETGLTEITKVDYLLSEIDSVVLKPSIPDKPKSRNIIDPEDLNVPPNPPEFVPSVEPSIIGWIDLWKDIGLVRPVTQSIDEQGRTVIHFATFDGSQTYDIVINAVSLDETGHIDVDLLPTGNTADKIPLLKGTVNDGQSIVYSEADGGFIAEPGFDPDLYQTVDNLVTSTEGWGQTPSDEKYPSEKLVKDSIDDVAGDLSAHIADINNPHQVDKAQVGLGNVVNAPMDSAPTQGSTNYVTSGGAYMAIGTVQGNLDTHEADVNNPHQVTKAQVGLGSVVNAIMDNAPAENSTNYVASGGVYSAIGVVQGDIDTHEARTDNPHSVTKAQVGLGNADNTSDMDKPVSTAQQTALDAKLDDTQLKTSWSSPVSDSNIASEKLVKDTLDTKLNKSSQTSKVYATDSNGAQAMIGYGATAVGDYIVQRTATGQVTVPPTPVADTDAASMAFVNSSIATNTGTFMGTIDATDDLGLTIVEDPSTHVITSPTNAQISTALASYTWSTAPDNNDYCFVSMNKPSTTDVDEYRRFKFDGTDWQYEYTLNNSSFTQAQWDAINSGISAGNYVITVNGVSGAVTVQPTLIGAEGATGQNIKAINGTSLLGTGSISLQTPLTAGVDYQTPLVAGTDYQVPLVSGTNIKTINSVSVLGSGDIQLQTPLVAGTDYQVPLVSGTNIKTINSSSVLGSGDIALQTPLTAGVDYQTPLTFDSSPTQSSTNPVTSGGVYTALAGKVSGPVSSTDDNVVLFDGATGKLIKDSGKTIGASIPAPSPTDAGQALVVNQAGTGYTFGEAGKVDDVQINGVSVVANKIANIPVDSTLSSSSANAIQNQAVHTALGGKVDANSAITASGSVYSLVQYDTKGLVVAGKALEATDIPAIPTSKVTGFDTEVTGIVNTVMMAQFVDTPLNMTGVVDTNNEHKEFIITTPSRAYGVMILDPNGQVVTTESLVDADSITLRFGLPITPGDFTVSYVLKNIAS